MLILYNPATRECKKVSKPVNHTSRVKHSGDLEFAYDCVNDDYKILCITMIYTRDFDVRRETHVYSLKANSWKEIPIPNWGYSEIPTPSIVANNSLYWVCREHTRSPPAIIEVIQRYDLSSETYDEMPFDIEGGTRCYHRLVALKGRLHTMTTYKNGISIWMLNEEENNSNNNNRGWVQIFHSTTPSYFQDQKVIWPIPCAYSKDSNKILVGVEEVKESLLCSDLVSQTISRVHVDGLPIDDHATFIAIPWVESLVSLG